jgi:hypothetical protein
VKQTLGSEIEGTQKCGSTTLWNRVQALKRPSLKDMNA